MKDNSGRTLFLEAVEFERFDVAKLLFNLGSNINQQTVKNYSPQHAACRRQHYELIKFLVDNGANVDALDSDDQTPLMILVKYMYQAAG